MMNSFVGLCAFAAMVAGSAAAAGAAPKSKIEIKDRWYSINGHKFFVNAIGYEVGARPGEDPYNHRVSNLAQIRQDLANIKAAGFNGIRTWSDLTEDELKLVQESGLKVVFGLNVKPDEDFSDPKVVAANLDHVRQTLAYSKKYDCVITYLIMNEPMPAHVRKVGAQATLDLWIKLRDLIHAEDPGVPVAMSGNSAITGWQDLNIFDVYAHNAYDYSTEGSNFTHTYVNTNRFVDEINGAHKPVLVTEFGRSVSRAGAGKGEYGGNTLQEQARALVAAYRSLLDSGAAGVCPFYYADGWWKAGEPEVHNDAPEEWFGFWGFKDRSDKVGNPRPVWYALATYNQALLTSPKNHEFYQNEVPVEAFVSPQVKSVKAIDQDGVVWEGKPDSYGYLSGSISFAGEDLKDRELVFESYDAQGRLVKDESLIVLTGNKPIEWPSLTLSTPVGNLEGAAAVPVEYQIQNAGGFALGNQLRIEFAPHNGWEPGETHVEAIDPALAKQTVSRSYTVPGECFVLGLYAGFDIRYGKFTRTIYAQKFLFRGNWADPIRLK